MSLLNGPLDTHLNYLNYIVLENCFDYFDLIESQKEKDTVDLVEKYQRLRLFLNALESMNNILVYLFYEQKEQQGWQDRQLNDVIVKMRNKQPILRDIAQLSTAYKCHSQCDMKKLVATDLQASVVSMTSIKKKIDIDFHSIKDELVISEAFDFWFEYNKNPDITILLP